MAPESTPFHGAQDARLARTLHTRLLHLTDAPRIELGVDHAWLKRRGLGRLDDIREGPVGHLHRLGEALDPEPILRVPLVELLPEGLTDLRVRRHEDARLGPVHARLPGALPRHDAAVGADLPGRFAEVPDRSLAVLRIPVVGVLSHLPAPEEPVADDDAWDAEDLLDPVRDGEYVDVLSVLEAAGAVGRPRLERE